MNIIKKLLAKIHISQKRYVQFFLLVVVFLGMLRAVRPSIAENVSQTPDSAQVSRVKYIAAEHLRAEMQQATSYHDHEGKLLVHPIYSVPNFKNTFPDENDVQLEAAQRNGVQPVADIAEAEKRKSELVFVGANPYFDIDKLKSSIPYLVPSASVLLQDIGRNFFDSLQVKGVPLHKLIVTSVLRSKEDVEKLRRRNLNAAQNSCHQYGTTFDICYNRYTTVEDPAGPHRRQVTNDTLKWVLSEVLRDMREQDRCLVKYEVKQGCFHITVK